MAVLTSTSFSSWLYKWPFDNWVAGSGSGENPKAQTTQLVEIFFMTDGRSSIHSETGGARMRMAN